MTVIPALPRRLFWLRRLLLSQAGASAVEMGLLLPVFLLMLLGICEFGRALWTQSTLQYAVEQAARCASLDPDKCTPNVQTYAANLVVGPAIPPADFTYTAGASCGVSGNTKGAEVSVAYPFTSVVATMIPQLSVTLSASSCHP